MPITDHTDAIASAQKCERLERRGWGTRAILALLVAACLLPATLVSTYFIVANHQQRRDTVIHSVVQSARNLSSALDRDLGSIESGLLVLATSPTLRSGDLAAFQDQVMEVLPSQSISHYVLIDPKGHQRLNTLRTWGEPLPTGGWPIASQQVIQQEAIVLTDLFIGPLAGQPMVALCVPVRKNSQVIYTLNAGISLERISSLLHNQGLPPVWVTGILDGQGVVIARSREAARFVGKPAVPDLVRQARQQREGTLETRTAEGIPVIAAFSRSARFNWTAVVGVPTAELTSGLNQSLWLLMGINLLAFFGFWWLAWQFALKRMVYPTDQLSERMRQVSKAQDPGSLDLSIFEGTRELRVLAEGFEHMRQRLRQRDTERQAMIQQLTNTLECISDGFLTLDATWHITYVNAQAEKLLRRQRRDLLGSTCWSILADQEAQPLRLASEQALLTCQATRLAVCLPSLDLHLEVSIYPSNQGLTYYCRDISELNRAHEAQAAQRAAEAANQAKSEFLSRMSHELRTPLNSVLGFAQILRINHQEPLSPPQAEMVKHIESAGQHLLAVISDVLDLSRIETGSLRLQADNVDIQALATDCLQMLDAQARTALITLQLDLDMPPGEIRADRTRLKQILLNLLSNAIKYNRPQGTITLAIHLHQGEACFSVCDTGIGLSKMQLNLLFQPFNRLGREHGNVPGTGIGLVISKRLISAMGSSLQVNSQEGLGSTFSFSLPLAGMANADH